jgi:hypothetical protein
MLTVNADYSNPVTDVYHLLLVYVQSLYQTINPASPAVIKKWHLKENYLLSENALCVYNLLRINRDASHLYLGR